MSYTLDRLEFSGQADQGDIKVGWITVPLGVPLFGGWKVAVSSSLLSFGLGNFVRN